MADRRKDESTPLAPRRSLGASSAPPENRSHTAKRPFSERVSAAVTSASDSLSSAASSAGRSGRPDSASSGGRGPSSARPASSPSRARGTRKARLRLVRVDPWSVMKSAFLLSIAFGIVTVISVAIVWSVLGAAGVWDSINQTVQEVLGGESGETFDVENYVGTSRVMGFTMIVAVVDVVLITAIATLGAFLYNLSATLLGGLEVTLAEDDR